MESWGVFFLGVIALASVVQAGFLIGLVIYGRRLAQRVDALQLRLDREISPALENFNRVSRAAAEIAEDASGYVDRQREALERRRERLAAAVEAGRQAYREEKEKS
jgi:hypothetical protein